MTWIDMAKFLNTSGTTYHLEELIKGARDKLILISPFLRLNDRIKELLEDKDRMKIDIRVVYGKNELHPAEIQWLNALRFVRTSYCRNLHAKCYLSESAAIVTSLNLYEFSQVNNNEMGILIAREDDAELYRDVADEAQRIIRVSEEVRISLETVRTEESTAGTQSEDAETADDDAKKLPSSRIAAKLKFKNTGEFLERCEATGFVERSGDDIVPSAKGSGIGAELRKNRHGPYILWPEGFDPAA
jgi:phosphatidylserine/phosphatidylglycerophosphate/cardiolipin synthase-like enzyme